MSRSGRLLPSLFLAALLRLPACPFAAAQPAQPIHQARSAQPAQLTDKALHVLFGASCALLASAIAAPALRETPQSDLGYALCVAGAGLTAAVGAGAAKELLDLAGFGNPEWLDLLATAAGGLAVSAAVLAASSADREAHLAPVYASFGIALALPPAGSLLSRPRPRPARRAERSGS
jgi:hypothetical protein